MARARKSSRFILILIAAVIVAGALTAAFWPRAQKVDMGTVGRGTLRVTIDEQGHTRVRDTYVVSTPVAGRLLRVDLEPGDPVARGETVVARMLPTNPDVLDIRTREQARAAVTAADAALQVALADYNAARADQDLALAELDRTRTLHDRGIASDAALDRAEQAARVADAQVDTAEAAIRMRKADLANARALLISFDEEGQPAEDAAQPEIVLHTPSDGRVLRLFQTSETILPAGAPIMEIGDVAGDLEVAVELLSTDAVQVSVGDPVILTGWGGPRDLMGEVARIDPFGVTRTSALGVEEQRVTVIVALTSDQGAHDGLGHGFRVETRIVVWEQGDTLIVPASALFREGEGWAAFRVEDGRAALTPVKVGRTNGIETQVIGGLEQGDRVVLYPSAALADGARVAQRRVE